MNNHTCKALNGLPQMGRHLSSQEVMYDVVENPLYGGAMVRATLDVENTSVRHLWSAKTPRILLKRSDVV